MIYILSKERNLAWPKVLKRAVCAFNASVNSTTKVSPWEAVRGTPYLINVPNPNAPTATDPCRYRQEICSAISAVQKSVRVANLEADFHFKNQKNSRNTRPPLVPGDRCCIYRPLARDKDKNFDWVGDFTVIESNDRVSQLKCNRTLKTDWYSNHQIKLLPQRPKHLEPDSDDELLLVPAVQESGGAEGVSNTNSERPKTTEICHPTELSGKQNQSSGTTQNQAVTQSKKGRKRGHPSSFPPRPPSQRKRSKTEKLNITSTSGKTYAAITRQTSVFDPSLSTNRKSAYFNCT